VSRSSKWSLPFSLSSQYIVRICRLSHPCYMSYPSHSPWCDHSSNIWWCVQVTKLLIMWSSPASRHFLSLGCKYSPYSQLLYLCPPLLVREICIISGVVYWGEMIDKYYVWTFAAFF
jgi:hypothetical protein